MTNLDQSNSTARFSDRVQNYVRYRPSYPDEVLDFLRNETCLRTDSVVADVGSGTGISAQMFLRNGNTVYGVEPNQQMRQAAEPLLREFPGFHSVDGTSEATTLGDASVDHVVAAQAFHWFDVERTKDEFARILRPDGWVILIWNARRLDSTPFLRGYESLLQNFGTDYLQVRAENIGLAAIENLFADGVFVKHEVYNQQTFDFDGLKGRLLSSSYTPPVTHPNHERMLAELRNLFDQNADSGLVRFEYDTKMFCGRVR